MNSQPFKTKAENPNRATEMARSGAIETKLISRIAEKQDRLAMEQLYHLYRQKLGSFLYRMSHNKTLVDEVYNEVMMIVWQKAQQFDGRSKLSTWIYAIAYRQCLQTLRKEHKHSADDIEEQFAGEITDLKGEEDLDEKQLIATAIAKLTDAHRQVIELSYFTGCNYKEIGMIVDRSENTIKTRMFHAKKKLKEIIVRLRGGI